MIYDIDSIKKRKEKTKHIQRIVLISICAILSLPFIYKILITYTNIPWNINLYTITSDSMYPEIREGDIIVVKRITEDELVKGDIISFKKDTEIITHRIREKITIDGKNQFITKGDNNKIQDEEPIKYEDIEGKEIYLIPYLGYVIIVMKNKFVIMAIILLIAIKIYRNERKKVIRRRKKDKMEKTIYGVEVEK